MGQKTLTGEEFYEVAEAVYQKLLLQHGNAIAPPADDREHRALVMVLRVLLDCDDLIIDEYDALREHFNEATTIARFIWPEAFAEAVKDE